MDFVRPGIMADSADPMVENRAALAAGMTAGKVYKVVAVWCPHRKRTMLQQIHDNDQPATTRPTIDEQTRPQTDEQILETLDEQWARLGQNSISTNTTRANGTKATTPENAPRISSDDSARKELLAEFNEESEQKMQGISRAR